MGNIKIIIIFKVNGSYIYLWVIKNGLTKFNSLNMIFHVCALKIHDFSNEIPERFVLGILWPKI